MYKVLFLSLLAFILFNGCSANTPSSIRIQKEPMYVDENTLILFALDAQTRNSNAEAVGYYDLLYARTSDKVYQESAMGALINGGYYNDVVARLLEKRKQGEELSEQDLHYLIIAYMAKKEIEHAKAEAIALVDKNPVEENYLMLAEVYLAQQDFINGLATLEEAYQLNYSEKALDRIAVVIYTNMNSPYQAIARIEQHSKTFGYSLILTKRLAAFYGDQRDEEGLLQCYPHLYALEPSEANADILIQLYWNAKKVSELMQFLERTHANDDLLLKIYTSQKMFPKAIVLSEKLYDETGDIDYLGQKAIYQYEGANNRGDKKLLDSVIADLTKVVETKEEGYYLNYLGYCMIEHDRNVTAGIAYVKRALSIEPDSGYFIDSLAWGYYKQGECDKAGILMEKVVELLGAEDPEVKAHLKAINTCIKRKNVK